MLPLSAPVGDPLSAQSRAAKKKYVTRACDVCKRRKSRCDGEEPCYRCQSKGIDCTYDASYNRVKRSIFASKTPSGPPSPPSEGIRSPRRASRRSNYADVSANNRESLSDDFSQPFKTSNPSGSLNLKNDLEEEGLGDASNMYFVRRIYNHLSLATSSDTFPRAVVSQDEGEEKRAVDMSSFLLPSRESADKYFECYFDHSGATYRYLDRPHIEGLLDRFYQSDDEILEDHSKVALLLMVMAEGCAWLPSFNGGSLSLAKKTAFDYLTLVKNWNLIFSRSRIHCAAQSRLDRVNSIFPPPLSTIQAYVTSCHVQLAMSKYNAAWMALGTAIRLAQAVNLHKAILLKIPGRIILGKGCFGRSLCLIVMGRPTAINENDISQDYPNSFETTNSDFGKEESSLIPGVVAHVKITRIIGRIKASLYPAEQKFSLKSRDKIVSKLAEQLDQWLEDTPSFFHPDDKGGNAEDQPFYKVAWIVKRQQKTVRNAFNFASMLLYRGCLLQEILERPPPTSPQTIAQTLQPSEASRKCVSSALKVAQFAAEISEDNTYNAVYWCTSYFTLCSIAVLLVHLTFHQNTPDYHTIELVVDKAMKGHERLSHDSDSQARRVLNESRHIATATRQATMPVDLSTKMGAAVPQQFDLQQLGIPFTTADHSFPMLNEYEYSSIDLAWQNDFFKELSGGGSFGDGAGLDMIMNVGFDEF